MPDGIEPPRRLASTMATRAVRAVAPRRPAGVACPSPSPFAPRESSRRSQESPVPAAQPLSEGAHVGACVPAERYALHGPHPLLRRAHAAPRDPARRDGDLRSRHQHDRAGHRCPRTPARSGGTAPASRRGRSAPRCRCALGFRAPGRDRASRARRCRRSGRRAAPGQPEGSCAGRAYGHDRSPTLASAAPLRRVVRWARGGLRPGGYAFGSCPPAVPQPWRGVAWRGVRRPAPDGSPIGARPARPISASCVGAARSPAPAAPLPPLRLRPARAPSGRRRRGSRGRRWRSSRRPWRRAPARSAPRCR